MYSTSCSYSEKWKNPRRGLFWHRCWSGSAIKQHCRTRQHRWVHQRVLSGRPLPVIGASTSSMHFSWRRMLAPSLMILRAASSSTRPSLTRWLRSSSALGLPSSNSSFKVSLCCGGYGTAVERNKTSISH